MGRTVLAMTMLLVLTLSGSAAADEYPPCDKKPTSDDVEAAKGMHKAAEQYYAKARYDRAIESWKDAYSFDCTAHRLLINVGNAYEKLGKPNKAIEAFDAYIARMGEAADPTIVEKVKNLRELVSSQGPPNPNPVPDPSPNPTPDPTPDPDVPDDGADPGPWPWVVVGGGAALAIVGAVLLGVGVKKENEAFDLCGGRSCPSDRQDLIDLGNEGLTLQVAGGTVLAVGLVAVAGGVVWYLIGSNAFGTAANEKKKLPFRIDVGATPEFSGLTATGSF